MIRTKQAQISTTIKLVLRTGSRLGTCLLHDVAVHVLHFLVEGS